jgi:hypothetical protein
MYNRIVGSDDFLIFKVNNPMHKDIKFIVFTKYKDVMFQEIYYLNNLIYQIQK